MGDRTTFQLYVYDAPTPEAVAAVFAVIDDYALTEDGSGPIPDTIGLGDCYSDNDASCGSAEEVAAALVNAGATFQCWEDPKYEWLGDLHIHVPDLGHWSSPCDADGNPVVPDDTLAFIAEDAATLYDLRAALAEARGFPHRDVIEALANKVCGTTIDRPGPDEGGDQ